MIKLELQWFLDKGCIVVNIQHWADYTVVLWKREWSIQEIGIPDLQLLASRNGPFGIRSFADPSFPGPNVMLCISEVTKRDCSPPTTKQDLAINASWSSEKDEPGQCYETQIQA